MQFSIIISTRNRYDSLHRLIASINAQSYAPPFEMLIADQSDQKQEPMPLQNGGSRWLPMTECGLSRGRNLGARNARGEYLVFLDDDVVLTDRNFLDKIEALVAKHPGCAGFVPLILNMEDNRPFSRYAGFSTEEVGLNNFDCCGGGSFVAARKAVFDSGLFDENFGVGSKYGGSEESDLILRMLGRGARILYEPSIKTHHPRADIHSMTIRALWSKGYSYGVGRGAMLHKHFRTKPLWAAGQLVLAVLRPAAGAVMASACLRGRKALRYVASITGRVWGFIIYRAGGE